MNPYEVLAVAADADPAEIHRAYLRLARRYHPDYFVNAGAPERAEAEERMRAVNRAWALLGDPASRRAWEAGHPRPFQPFSPDENDPDPREMPDIPYHPTTPPTGRERATTLAPVLLFAASVVVGLVGSFMRHTGTIALAFVLFLLACLGFVVVPLLALSRARQDEG